MTALVEFVEARLTDDERVALAATRNAWTVDRWTNDHGVEFTVVADYDMGAPAFAIKSGADAAHIARHDPARVLREVAAKRRILAEHKPQLRTVEWPHDQTGDGHGWTCPRCQNVENDASDWHPPIGGAGVFPKDDFVTPYVLAPCLTLAVLASVWSDHPDYRSEWSPS